MDKAAELPKVMGLLDAQAKAVAGFDPDLDIVVLGRSRESAEFLSKHLHDLRGCARSVEIVLKMIEDGESFEGEQNRLMLEQVRQSTEVLKPTVNFLKSIYAAGG